MNALIIVALVALSVASAAPAPQGKLELGYAVVLKGSTGEGGAAIDGSHTGSAKLVGPQAAPISIVGPSVGAVAIVGPSFHPEAPVVAQEGGYGGGEIYKQDGYGWII